MSADDAQWRICADDASLIRRRAFDLYDARKRILRMLCADANNAQIRMCAAAHYSVMRIRSVCICAYYTNFIRECTYYAHMRT